MHNRVRIAKKLETFAVRERSPFIRFSNFRTIQFERGVRDASIFANSWQSSIGPLVGDIKNGCDVKSHAFVLRDDAIATLAFLRGSQQLSDDSTANDIFFSDFSVTRLLILILHPNLASDSSRSLDI